MTSITKHVQFVNKQALRVEEILNRHPEDKRAKTAYAAIIRNYRALATDLTEIDSELDAMRKQIDQLSSDLDASKRGQRPSSLDSLELTPDDINGLPPEVLEQLSIGESELQEFAILSLIDSAGGTISLDKLIILLWKTNNEVHDRAKLNSKLYRMMQKGIIFSVPDRRGVYSIYAPETQQPSISDGLT